MAIADIDRDLDLDVLTLHRDGQVGVLENMLHLQFRGRMLDEIPRTTGSTSISVADVDGNVSWDLVISGDKETVVVFSQTADAGIWTVERVVTEQVAMPQAIVADLDNDSWSELVSADAKGGEYSRLGPWGIDPPVALDATKISTPPYHAADFNSDGKLDLAAINGGKIQVSINKTIGDRSLPRRPFPRDRRQRRQQRPRQSLCDRLGLGVTIRTALPCRRSSRPRQLTWASVVTTRRVRCA